MQVFLSRSEDVHNVWLYASGYFLLLFSQFELSNFSSTSTKANRHWVSCESNFSYNFSGIVLKLRRCFCKGLEMLIRFGCNPQMIFVTCFAV